MNKFLKTIACLYAGIVAATAQTITFRGNESIQGHEYLRFVVSPHLDGIAITRVTIDEARLNPGNNEVILTSISDKEVFGMQT